MAKRKKLSNKQYDKLYDLILTLSRVVSKLSDEEKTALLSSKAVSVRAAIAKSGNEAHRQALLDDDSDYVISALIEADKSLARYFTTDKSLRVMLQVAKHGTDEDRDDLLKHFANRADTNVAAVLARYGNDHHRKILLKDDIDYDDDPSFVFENIMECSKSEDLKKTAAEKLLKLTIKKMSEYHETDVENVSIDVYKDWDEEEDEDEKENKDNENW